MILDACRDNPTVPPEYKTKGGGPQGGLAKIPAPQGTFIMYAAAPGSVSYDRLGAEDKDPSSVYTRALLPLLEQANLSIQDLAIKVREKVYTLTSSLPRKQIPEHTDGIIGHFCIDGCQAQEFPVTPPALAKVPTPQLDQRMEERIGGVKEPPMVVIPPGTFKRDGQLVRIPRAFAMGKYEVTFAEYDNFAQATGGQAPEDQGWGRGQRPVINVSWEDARAYAKWLSRATGKSYRLPTEAEWEYAARSLGKEETWAGTSQESELGDYAVYSNLGGKTAEVGSKQPNGLGLYDMSDMRGNVYEWVEDCWHNTYNFDGAPTDGSAWLEERNVDCGRRVMRGGSWDIPGHLRASPRNGSTVNHGSYNLGFRLVQDTS